MAIGIIIIVTIIIVLICKNRSVPAQHNSTNYNTYENPFYIDLVPKDPVLGRATQIVNLYKCHTEALFYGNEIFATDLRKDYDRQFQEMLKNNPQEIVDSFAHMEKEESVYIIYLKILLEELKFSKYYFMCDLTPLGRQLCTFINNTADKALSKNYIDEEARNNIREIVKDTVKEYKIYS